MRAYWGANIDIKILGPQTLMFMLVGSNVSAYSIIITMNFYILSSGCNNLIPDKCHKNIASGIGQRLLAKDLGLIHRMDFR